MHVLSARNREKRLWFGSKSAPSWNVTIVCLRRVSQPWSFGSSWFRGVIWDLFCFFVNSTNFKARSIFSFLNLSYIKDWSGKYIHCSWIFCDAWCPNGIFYRIAAGTNLKNETTSSNQMSRTWHKRSETSPFTQSKVTISRTQSSEISQSNEKSRCDRCTRWLLSTMIWPIVVTHVPVEWSNCSHTLTHCGHKGNRPSRCARWPLRQTNVVVPDTVIFAVKPENGASLERSKATHYNLQLLLVSSFYSVNSNSDNSNSSFTRTKFLFPWWKFIPIIRILVLVTALGCHSIIPNCFCKNR